MKIYQYGEYFGAYSGSFVILFRYFSWIGFGEWVMTRTKTSFEKSRLFIWYRNRDILFDTEIKTFHLILYMTILSDKNCVLHKTLKTREKRVNFVWTDSITWHTIKVRTAYSSVEDIDIMKINRNLLPDVIRWSF